MADEIIKVEKRGDVSRETVFHPVGTKIEIVGKDKRRFTYVLTKEGWRLWPK